MPTKHIKRNRSSKKRSTHKRKYIHHHHDVDVTFCGLNVAYKAMYEKLGWMLLAQKYNMLDKIAEYKNSIHRIINAMKHKKKHISDCDKKDDLDIMINNLTLLHEHVEKDFGI
jgi:hypothetical protein